MADGTGPASTTTPHPAAEQAGPQVLRAPVAAALPSPPPDPLPGLAAALRGLTHETASSSMIRYQTDDEGVVSQPEYTFTKPSNGRNDRDHLTPTPSFCQNRDRAGGFCGAAMGSRNRDGMLHGRAPADRVRLERLVGDALPTPCPSW